MNTKVLMLLSSIFLGIAGVGALFAPQELLTAIHMPVTEAGSTPIQVMGALYFSFALINWTAKDGIIGGVYARPISLGNFAHFTVGALVLAKAQLVAGAPALLSIVLIVYVVFALVFGWLVFVYSGIDGQQG